MANKKKTNHFMVRTVGNIDIFGTEKFFEEWDKAIADYIASYPGDKPTYQTFCKKTDKTKPL